MPEIKMPNYRTPIYAIRPHHPLCIEGYKGYARSPENKSRLDEVCGGLRSNPESKIMIIEGEDALCFSCPNGKNALDSCKDKAHIKAMDDKVRDLLGLVTHKIYTYGELIKKLREIMTPKIHEGICSDCTWWKQGVCKDTFKKSPFKILQ